MAGALAVLAGLIWLVVGLVAPGARAWLAADQATPEPIPCAGEVVAPTLRLTLDARPVAVGPTDPTLLSEAGRVVAARARQLGLGGCRVEVHGDGRIVVALAGVDDPGEAARILSRTGLLEIVDTRGAFLAPGTVVRTSLGGPECVGLDATPAPDGPVYPTIVSGADIADAFLTTGVTGVERVVGFRLTDAAADVFFDFTSAHIGLPLAIVLDKRVVSAPVIQQAIAGEGIITGVAEDEVDDPIVQLKSRALPLPLAVVAVERVDPAAGGATPGLAASPVGVTGG